MADHDSMKSSDEMLAEIREWLASDLPTEEPVERPEPEAEAEAEAGAERADRNRIRLSPSTRADPIPVARAPERTTAPRPRRVRRRPSPSAEPGTEQRSVWNGAGPWLLLGLVFIGFGAWLLVWGVSQFSESSSWIEVEGTVVAIDGSEEGVSVEVLYLGADGEPYRVTSSAEDDVRLGDSMDVLVDPDDPTRATTQRDRIVAFVLRLVFGGVGVLAGFVPIWWGRRLAARRP
ncbi:MAG: DUF3592 domain-containing protein [Acidimicrobiia bacterium]|nr:DUF3592 domain-containing protein [Acidimicrobiia bacterium]